MSPYWNKLLATLRLDKCEKNARYLYRLKYGVLDGAVLVRLHSYVLYDLHISFLSVLDDWFEVVHLQQEDSKYSKSQMTRFRGLGVDFRRKAAESRTSKQTSLTPSPWRTRCSPISLLPGNRADSKTKIIWSRNILETVGRRMALWQKSISTNLVLLHSMLGYLATSCLQPAIGERFEAEINAVPVGSLEG